MEDGAHLAELYLLDTARTHLTRLTHENDALLEGLQLSQPERIVYPSFDGRSIEAWLVKPPRFDAKKKYPLILNIHGGPHVAYGETLFHEFQWMAARGYVVLAPNPRGSASYGREFGNAIQYNYPGDDYKDLMAGVDEVLRRGYIDEKRLGVTGGSGGGLLTNWVIAQTPRFAAAVSQRSISDWAAFWYSTDFTLFTPFWFRKFPFQDPEEYRRRSPITYVDRVTTPLMLIEGDRDLRAPTDAGGGAIFRALKALHKVAVMVVFPGETHDLSCAGSTSTCWASRSPRTTFTRTHERDVVDRLRVAARRVRGHSEIEPGVELHIPPTRTCTSDGLEISSFLARGRGAVWAA
jgi:dipeptidyl aminopeptidase/acylaminoacyl peptidase